MDISLVVMAAGIGSRYGGGVKQIAKVGPNDEILMDYVIHDALEAGFNKVVFVIRKDLEEDFKEVVGNRIEKLTDVSYAFQETDDLPGGLKKPEGRTKPWGTIQALLCAKDVIDGPFAVVNADDFYGRGAMVMLYDYLVNTPAVQDGKINIGMVSYILKNTLSENGGVTRGICRVDDDNKLVGIDETKNIIPVPDGAAAMTDDGLVPVDEDSQVSMNLWGFFPEILDRFEEKFMDFLKAGAVGSLTDEYVLPAAIDEMIKNGEVSISIDKSEDRWFGITYKDDLGYVQQSIAELIDKGVYSSPLA